MTQAGCRRGTRSSRPPSAACSRPPQDPRFGALLDGLPVAGFDGTLAKRYRTSPAAGEVRAKTGTLNGVSALAGLVHTHDGAVLAFAFTANGIPLSGTQQAQAALDRLAAALAGCGCR